MKNYKSFFAVGNHVTLDKTDKNMRHYFFDVGWLVVLGLTAL